MAPPGAAGGRADVPHDKPLWPLRPAPSFASNDSVYPYDEMRPPSARGAGRRGVKKMHAVLTLLAAVVLVGGAVLLHWYDDADTREQRATSIAAQGTVASNDMSQPNQAATTPQGPIAQGTEATQGSTTPKSPQNEDALSPSSTSGDKGYGDKHHRLIALALARAHDGLERNDLHTARSGIYWALSLQSDNREALLLKQDLLSRERARDAALKAARSCVGQERRQCVWQNASHALSIDSSSAGAKALVGHSVVDSGKASKPLGLAPSQPDEPRLQ
ncbi:hypothetical protein [Caballeronia ptereochthonis]|uniref:Uncharacterized protein n=1 Tax=Caballeronia ptereochthonis TaxID=1777144 RepID=A0A157ZV95_9BURK|nr:hypothetical protein [Caballeronia ptereochthonis]SAK49393.1 hypothetical protein AWB83_01051 [Caballeronia ptereochthonis]